MVLSALFLIEVRERPLVVNMRQYCSMIEVLMSAGNSRGGVNSYGKVTKKLEICVHHYYQFLHFYIDTFNRLTQLNRYNSYCIIE